MPEYPFPHEIGACKRCGRPIREPMAPAGPVLTDAERLPRWTFCGPCGSLRFTEMLDAGEVPADPPPPPAGSLDHRTELVAPPHHSGRVSPYVAVTIYPTAGEATLGLVTPQRIDLVEAEPKRGDDLAPEAHWERANRRARGVSRRYMVHNRLRYMWVLTYRGDGQHGPDGRRQAMAHVAQLVRQLRAVWGDFPYWYSPELHPGGHGWHVNFFVARRFPHRSVERTWHHGFVWVTDWAKDKRASDRTLVERIRRGAAYGAKYASKDWDAEQLAGHQHRYERAEGYDPPTIVAECRTIEDGIAVAVSQLGAPTFIWRSSDEIDWAGPPCAWVCAPTAAPG